MAHIIKQLKGEFVSVDVVKEATQKDYNVSEWNKTVDRYNKYSETQFFKTEGTIYPFDYYVIYVADGIRFLQKVSLGSCLSNNGFAFGFIVNGLKDPEIIKRINAEFPELKELHKDELNILSFEGNTRAKNCSENRVWMREQTKLIKDRFFTNDY